MPNYNKGPMTDAEAMMRRFYNKGPMTDFDRQMPQSMGSSGLLDAIRGLEPSMRFNTPQGPVPSAPPPTSFTTPQQPMDPNQMTMPLGGLLQMSGNAPQIPQDRPISPIVQQAISDSINIVREEQGLPPASQEQNFLFYIEADPQLKQLIEQRMKDIHIQKSGTGI